MVFYLHFRTGGPEVLPLRFTGRAGVRGGVLDAAVTFKGSCSCFNTCSSSLCKKTGNGFFLSYSQQKINIYS